MGLATRRFLPVVALLAVGLTGVEARGEEGEDEKDRRIRKLETRVDDLTRLVETLTGARPAPPDGTAVERAVENYLAARSGGESEAPVAADGSAWYRRMTLGGYGEIHANFVEGADGDQIDIHRFVLYVGYEFADWIQLHSETEIEHAYVTSDSGGEITIEQMRVDLLLADVASVRLGRILVPVGIINPRHEPTAFHGVERPAFAKYVVPSTWYGDGAGVFGRAADWLSYEVYVLGSLDGSEFDARNGIRGGRLKERPGLTDLAVTGRLDIFPCLESERFSTVRIGVSSYAGGIDNGNKGENPGLDGSIVLVAIDAEGSIGPFDLRGAIAWEKIGDAKAIGNGAAKEILGWYLEAAWRLLPDAWKSGRLENCDAAMFVRYESFDTQYRMPSGVDDDPAGDREQWTAGITFHLTPSFVIKADWRLLDDATKGPGTHYVDLGVGWQF